MHTTVYSVPGAVVSLGGWALVEVNIMGLRF